MIESLLAEIADAGWLVNNLFQLRDGSWQCNLRRGDLVTSYGWGSTPSDALGSAITHMADTLPMVPQITMPTMAPRVNLRDLLPRRRVNIDLGI